MRFLEFDPPDGAHKSRSDVRAAAIQMASSISAAFPDLRVAVDLQTVDGEDAFVWISLPSSVRPVGLAELLEKVSRRQNRTTGFWIVPRIVSSSFRTDPVFRLRPRLFEDPKPILM